MNASTLQLFQKGIQDARLALQRKKADLEYYVRERGKKETELAQMKANEEFTAKETETVSDSLDALITDFYRLGGQKTDL